MIAIFQLSIFSLIAFVNELDVVGRGTYGIADAALNVLLTAPGRMVGSWPQRPPYWGASSAWGIGCRP